MSCYARPGTCPSDCKEHDDPHPLPTTQPLPIICDLYCPHGTPDPLNCRCLPFNEEPEPLHNCQTSGGTWKEFKNGCADTCAYNADPSQMCTESLTYSCDCSPGRCWNGTGCEQNPFPTFKPRSVNQSPIQQIIDFFTSFTRRFRIH